MRHLYVDLWIAVGLCLVLAAITVWYLLRSRP